MKAEAPLPARAGHDACGMAAAPAERLAPLQWLGIALTFCGLAIAFFGAGGATLAPTAQMLWGDLLGLSAGMLWGATTVVVRCSRLSSAPATQTLLYPLLGGFGLMSIAALVSGQTLVNLTPALWASLAFQSVVVAFASFVVWFWLLRHYLASRLGVFSFLTLLFGVALGALLLGKRLEPGLLLGVVPLLVGIVLVGGHGVVSQAQSRLLRRTALA